MLNASIWAFARRFFGGQQVGEACTRYRGVHNAVKSGFLELYFLFCLSGTHKWKSAYSFLSLGSYLNMYHGCASLENEHFWPVFTEKRAPFQHILRHAKSTIVSFKKISNPGDRPYERSSAAWKNSL